MSGQSLILRVMSGFEDPNLVVDVDEDAHYVTIHLLQHGRHPTIDSDSKIPSIQPQSLAVQVRSHFITLF